MRKSSFLTFCFAFIPGAGQMYLGMMKKGVSIMLTFSVIVALAGFLNLGFLTVLLPVLWFYSFFDTFNIKSMTYEERMSCEDRFLFDLDRMFRKDWMGIMKKRHALAGGICIFLGIYMIYNSFLRSFLWELEDYFPWVAHLMRSLPTLIVAIAVIILGFWLVAGGRKKAASPDAQEDDFVEYGGDNHET
ncbi:hypothetical protein [Ligaoa zhengdingensis]